MPLTFPANSNVNLLADTGIPLAGGCFLVMGWWYPTTIADNRTLWSTSSINRLDFASSKLRLTIDASTTDGVYGALGLTLSTGTWYHVSTLLAVQNASTAGVRIWVGVGTDPPTEQAVTRTTAPVGNFTAGTSFYVANAAGTGSGTTFLGDVSDVSYLSEDVAGIAGALGLGTVAIRDDEADNVYRRWVLPHWLGTPDPTQARASGATDGIVLRHFPMDSLAGSTPVAFAYGRHTNANTIRNSTLAVTVGGSPTVSDQAAPRRLPHNWPCLNPFVRR